MLEKYHSAADSGNSTIITNDIYLAAYLDYSGLALIHVCRNDRRRVSFVFGGQHVVRLRDAYNTGFVSVNFRDYKDSLARIRYEKDKTAEQRSNAHEREPDLEPVPQW